MTTAVRRLARALAGKGNVATQQHKERAAKIIQENTALMDAINRISNDHQSGQIDKQAFETRLSILLAGVASRDC